MTTYIGNQDSLTLHIRITKKCNADCSYCSSFEKDASDRMSLIDLNKSLDFLIDFIIKNKLGGNRKMLTVQYVGGELTTLPKEYLSSFCKLVEQKLSGLFKEYQHGGQSNLISSKDRINHLLEIFDGNIGTSIDNFTNQRTIKQSSNKYKTIFIENLTHTKKMLGKSLSSIIVLDDKMKPYIHEEIKIAEKNNMHITLRPIFNGGISIINVETDSLTETYNQIFDNWFMKSNIILEPHFSLLQKRLLKYQNKIKNLPSYSGCPFQSNCATSSINLEPNGDLYVCLDMADSKHYPFGNALTGEINKDIFNTLMSRTEKINSDCQKCDYFNECQGGCMNEAIEHTGDVFGKTQYCSTWKNLFSRIDNGIKEYGSDNVQSWINSLNNHK
jgi:radical SAM protein with 4Fe4S-binding SPASM domain